MRHLLALSVLASFAVALTDCATLAPLAGSTCGNGVIDANEDCDGFAPSAFTKGVCGGASEGAAACRLKCAGPADCPDGWGCSTAGICREATGRFGAIGEGVSAGVSSMVVGDFDGDHRTDILGSGPASTNSAAKVRVHYFGDGAALASVVNLAAPIVSPTVCDFNNDHVDDFAFGLELGAFGIMTGQLDRSLVPAIFPSGRLDKADVKPVLVLGTRRPMPSGSPSDFLFAGKFTTRTGEVVTALSSVEGDNPYIHALPVGIEGIVGDPISGPLLPDDGDSTCDEVAIALAAETPNGVIEVFSPCQPKTADAGDPTSAWASPRPPKRIDAPFPLSGGLHIADADGDGRLDILFGVKTANGKLAVYLAKSTGTDFAPPQVTSLEDLPIASGLLDADNQVDFVLPSALALSNATAVTDAGAADAAAPTVGVPFASYVQVDTGRRIRWTAARIGRFNDDDLPDVIASSEDQPDIDFLGAVGAGQFVHSTISTDGPVTRLAVGDFDGDRLVDVAFVQKRPGTVDSSDVSIAYGRANGPPEPPRIVGRTTDVVNLDPLFDPGSPNAVLQGLGLFILEKATDGGLPSLSYALIVGNGDRQPTAPLLLNDALAPVKDPSPDVYRQWVPLEVAVGPSIDANRLDLVTLAVGYRISRSQRTLAAPPYPAAVWIAPGKGGTAFDPPILVNKIGDFDLGDRQQVVFDVRTVAGDIDNPKDGKSEFVVMESPPGTNTMSLSIVHPPAVRSPTVQIPGETQRRDAPMGLYDVDADGNLDLVVLLGELDTGHVVVFYNDGKGAISAEGATVPLPDGEAAKGFTFVTTAGAPTQSPGAARRELAIVTPTRVYLASPSPADRRNIVPREVPREAGSTLISPTAIAAGDFDGDGVPDLAIADDGALRILRGAQKP